MIGFKGFDKDLICNGMQYAVGETATEEKAEWFINILFDKSFKEYIHAIAYIMMHSHRTEMIEWLKQPHKDE